MSKLILRLEDKDVEALARVLDASVKTLGIKVLGDAGHVWTFLSEALKERGEEIRDE